MRFAIVDDEKYFIDNLKSIISNISGIDGNITADPYYTGEELVKRYRAERTNYDMIFLDIELGGMDGMEVARRLRDMGFDNAIVFTTSHTEFNVVQQSHDVNALYYFQKPITEQNVLFCLEKLSSEKKFIYTYNGHTVIIPYSKIIYFEASRNYIQIECADKTIDTPRYRANIASIVAQVPANFIQCHRSFVINLSRVVILEEKQVFMQNLPDAPIPIGEKFMEAVYSAFYEL